MLMFHNVNGIGCYALQRNPSILLIYDPYCLFPFISVNPDIVSIHPLACYKHLIPPLVNSSVPIANSCIYVKMTIMPSTDVFPFKRE